MQQVFIGYESHNKKLAISLAEFLKLNGVRVFIDEWSIKFGERVLEVISHGMQASNTVVLLICKRALAGSWVETELDMAMQHEHTNKCRLLIVRISDVSLPLSLEGKKYIKIDDSWDEDTLSKVLGEIQPNIYRNGWPSTPQEFAGNGGRVKCTLLEEGLPIYRLQLEIGRQGGFSGVTWDIIRGGVPVSQFTHFSFKLRSASGTGIERLQLKMETNGPWVTYYINFPSSSFVEHSISLEKLGVSATSNMLHRVTVAVDDRDVIPGREYVLDVSDFYFYTTD